MVKCPVEDCDAEVLARGINLHVRQSSGGGHGPQGEAPDQLTFDDLKTVGSDTVEMDYPEERDHEQVARFCPYCSEVFTGKQGVRIHLGQVEGRKNHPRNANERHAPEDFPQVAVDDEGNVVGVLRGWKERDRDLPGGPRIPATKVYEYVAELLADDRHKEVQRARSHFFGTDYDEFDTVHDISTSLSEALEEATSNNEEDDELCQ